MYLDANSKLLLLSWVSLTASHPFTFAEVDPVTLLWLFYILLVLQTYSLLQHVHDYLLIVIFQTEHYFTQSENFSN